MGSAELYKKTVIEYLESRGYYVKMDSFVEGILADCILSRKGEEREYWLETKATTISLFDSKFASELGRYLAEYLIRSPQNRFKMILAVHGYRKRSIFESIYEELDEGNIKKLRAFIVSAADENVKDTIQQSDFGNIRQFFEETKVIRANLQGLQERIEQIHPKPPAKPKLIDAKYAAEVLDRYRTNQPLDEDDKLLSNLFALKVPDDIYIAPTEFSSAEEIHKNPEVIFPIFRLVGGRIYTFHPFSAKSTLGKTWKVESVNKMKLKEWDTTKDTANIVLFLVYRWIDEFCGGKDLSFDERTESYFFTDSKPREFAKKVPWQKAGRIVKRRVIIPYRREEDDSIYYYMHRAVQILVRSLWGDYFIQLVPKRVFSGDCYTPYPGDISDKIDRAYRKSIFTRNRNQLNDILFWSWHLFSGASMPIESYLKSETIRSRLQTFRVIEQISVLSDMKPNIPERDEEVEEDTEEIDTAQILDVFLTEED